MVLHFQRIRSSGASVGHSYNLIDTRARRILNVETASRNRISVREVQETPFFHANMYLHLQIQQVDANNTASQLCLFTLPEQIDANSMIGPNIFW